MPVTIQCPNTRFSLGLGDGKNAIKSFVVQLYSDRICIFEKDGLFLQHVELENVEIWPLNSKEAPETGMMYFTYGLVIGFRLASYLRDTETKDIHSHSLYQFHFTDNADSEFIVKVDLARIQLKYGQQTRVICPSDHQGTVFGLNQRVFGDVSKSKSRLLLVVLSGTTKEQVEEEIKLFTDQRKREINWPYCMLDLCR